MQEVNSALEECGFGWFHIRLLLIAFVGYTCGVSLALTTPYILPIAECDLDMDLVKKGVLNAIPYIGEMGKLVALDALDHMHCSFISPRLYGKSGITYW